MTFHLQEFLLNCTLPDKSRKNIINLNYKSPGGILCNYSQKKEEEQTFAVTFAVTFAQILSLLISFFFEVCMMNPLLCSMD